jgi:hypothetical protein
MNCAFLGKTGEASQKNTRLCVRGERRDGRGQFRRVREPIAVDRITALMPRCFRMSAMGLASGFADVLQELFADIHKVMLKHGPQLRGMRRHGGDAQPAGSPRSGCISATSGTAGSITCQGWRLADPAHARPLACRLAAPARARSTICSDAEARNHPMRNALNQALGAGHQFIDTRARRSVRSAVTSPATASCICSDGLIDGLWDRAP